MGALSRQPDGLTVGDCPIETRTISRSGFRRPDGDEWQLSGLSPSSANDRSGGRSISPADQLSKRSIHFVNRENDTPPRATPSETYVPRGLADEHEGTDGNGHFSRSGTSVAPTAAARTAWHPTLKATASCTYTVPACASGRSITASTRPSRSTTSNRGYEEGGTVR
jgi:hypothetical protein